MPRGPSIVSAFQPEHIEAMHAAYEKACARLRLTGKADCATERVAIKIIELAKSGELDPDRLCTRTLEDLGVKH
jgi:hypothetical protein